MPVSATIAGSALAGVLAVLALAFAVAQLRDRRRRRGGLGAADAAYFARQDARRLAGSLVMALLAAGMAAGLAIDPRAGPADRRAWAATWVGVMILVLALLALALWDWFALRRYAGRARRELLRERLAATREALDQLRRARGGNGRPPDG